MTRLRGPLTTERRFWLKVRRGESCWVWEGYRNATGYGVFSVGQKLVAAHRFRWELSNPPLENGQCVLHKCDNPSCVRIDHLFLGTQAANVRDMMTKGRGRKASGVEHGKSKLSATEVVEIRAATGQSLSMLSRTYGVSRSTVARVRNGLSYRDIIETGKVLE